MDTDPGSIVLFQLSRWPEKLKVSLGRKERTLCLPPRLILTGPTPTLSAPTPPPHTQLPTTPCRRAGAPRTRRAPPLGSTTAPRKIRDEEKTFAFVSIFTHWVRSDVSVWFIVVNSRRTQDRGRVSMHLLAFCTFIWEMSFVLILIFFFCLFIIERQLCSPLCHQHAFSLLTT